MTTSLPPRSEELDWPIELGPFDASSYAIQADPFPHFAWMRENAPLLRAQSRGKDLYFVSKYDDVRSALRAPKVFSSSTADPDDLPIILLMDPPQHTQLRGTVARAFTPKAVARFEDQIRSMSTEFLSPLLQAGGGDVATNFATQLTIGTIGGLLGIPVSELDRLKAWSDDFSNYFGRVARQSPGSDTDEQGVEEFMAFLRELLDSSEDTDEESVIGNLARLREAGQIDERDALYFCGILFVAGHETTTILISNGFLTASEQPHLLDLMRENPDYYPKFVEELARFRAAPQRLSRITNQAVEMQGYTIPRGAQVRLLPGSANRDSDMFPHGEKFDIERDTSGHLGFGHGIHACIGSWLARLEARVAFEVAAESIAAVRINDSVSTLYFEGGTMSDSGPRSMHVEFDLR